MEAIAEKYFLACEAEDKPFTITGVALALGLCGRDSLTEYGTRKEFSATVKKIKSRCEHYCELQLFGKNPVGAIFALKNYGWKDKSEVEHSGTIKTVTVPLPKKDASARPATEPAFED